jgi:hypothetical protein
VLCFYFGNTLASFEQLDKQHVQTPETTTPVQTTVSPQREEKLIPGTNPQHKQELQNKMPLTLCFAIIYYGKTRK